MWAGWRVRVCQKLSYFQHFPGYKEAFSENVPASKILSNSSLLFNIRHFIVVSCGKIMNLRVILPSLKIPTLEA